MHGTSFQGWRPCWQDDVQRQGPVSPSDVSPRLISVDIEDLPSTWVRGKKKKGQRQETCLFKPVFPDCMLGIKINLGEEPKINLGEGGEG